jgi:hypothetical protein
MFAVSEAEYGRKKKAKSKDRRGSDKPPFTS